MITRLLLPLPSSDLANASNDSISRSTSATSGLRGLDRWYNDLRASVGRSVVQRTIVVGTGYLRRCGGRTDRERPRRRCARHPHASRIRSRPHPRSRTEALVQHRLLRLSASPDLLALSHTRTGCRNPSRLHHGRGFRGCDAKQLLIRRDSRCVTLRTGLVARYPAAGELSRRTTGLLRADGPSVASGAAV